MPTTKSAERRMRSNERKHLHNKAIKSKLKTLEKKFAAAVSADAKEDAQTAFRNVVAGFDKAAKTGVIHSGRADRKKSRLAIRLARFSAAKPASASPAA